MGAGEAGVGMRVGRYAEISIGSERMIEGRVEMGVLPLSFTAFRGADLAT